MSGAPRLERGGRGKGVRAVGRGAGQPRSLTRAVTRACGGAAQVCSERTKFISIRPRGRLEPPRGDTREPAPRLKRIILWPKSSLPPLPHPAPVEGKRKPGARRGLGARGFWWKPCELWFLQSFPSAALPGTRCGASAAQHSRCGRPVAGDLISSTQRPTPFFSSGPALPGCDRGSKGPHAPRITPQTWATLRQVERTRVFAFWPRTVHRVSFARTCGTDWTGLGAQCSARLFGRVGWI